MNNYACYILVAATGFTGVSCANLQVTEIAFNHNTASWTQDALNVRKNATGTVTVPEWTQGVSNPKESPAAFVGGRTVKVRVKFQANRDGIYKVRSVGGPFELKEQTVQIQSGISNPTWIEFESTPIPASVDLADVTWKWRRKCGGVIWWTFDKSYHRFYVVQDVPKEPWTQTSYPDDQNPWTDALDYACTWAQGETTKGGVASAVTAGVNNGPYAYDMNLGATHYGTYSPRKHNLTAFLDRLNGGWGNGQIVNCTDCAMAVTSFSNLLGCELWSSRMGWGFSLNPIVPVGHTTFGCPNWGCSFSYHEVGWTGNAGANDTVFDGCLKVDGDSDPVHAPHFSILPQNMSFDNPAGLDYRERLVPPSSLMNCQPQASGKVRPPVF